MMRIDTGLPDVIEEFMFEEVSPVITVKSLKCTACPWDLPASILPLALYKLISSHLLVHRILKAKISPKKHSLDLNQ